MLQFPKDITSSIRLANWIYRLEEKNPDNLIKGWLVLYENGILKFKSDKSLIQIYRGNGNVKVLTNDASQEDRQTFCTLTPDGILDASSRVVRFTVMDVCQIHSEVFSAVHNSIKADRCSPSSSSTCVMSCHKDLFIDRTQHSIFHLFLDGDTELPYVNLQLTVVHKSLTICCDSDLLPYSTVRLCIFQRGIPAPVSILLPSNRNNWRSEDCIVLSSTSEAFAYRLKEEVPQMHVRNGSGFIYSPRDGIMTAGSCHGGLADQALKSSLLLGQSRTALLPRIFSSFLLQDLLLLPSDPHHWFTGLLLLHMNPPVLEIISLMKTFIVDCCVSREYASVGHVICHESCDGSTTSLIAQSSVHFHVPRRSLRPDPSQPCEMKTKVLLSALKVSEDGDGLNEIMISEAKAHTTEDSCQLCQRIDDSSLVLVMSM
ncbi:hypothetical protein T01_7728 [Trichinella spiralis]|uniref:Uncharacterized protein n=1 Tax=Trichinella spiralis TaxID=6334 RepID=A0A0V1AQ09_TRISP|nr:hypothetical protein T01_8130 [Trichinella spiralis]KRY26913.1 hypothetical protein T01_7728 [Trichinella spiralis]